MTITVSVPDQLAECAAGLGLSIEAYVGLTLARDRSVGLRAWLHEDHKF